MPGIFAFTCACCGARHEGSPSFGYEAPMHYNQLSATEKHAIAAINDDLCWITNPEGTDYFIRTVLEIPIHGIKEPFLWGVWVSLNQKSFEKYISTWSEHDETDTYFGWFSNRLAYYPDTVNLKTSVRPRNRGARPLLQLQPSDHPLATHFLRGLTVREAQQIAQEVAHGRS